MNKERLLKLADLLEADAKNPKGVKFDLSEWGEAVDPKTPVNCGTSACAVGLACISGAFKKEGLGYEVVEGKEWDDLDKPSAIYTINPTYKKMSGWDAVAKFFGIGYADAEYLFSSYEYNSIPKGAKGERTVAKRIREFCK